MNYYPFHLGDYAAHTAHLEPMEDLAYRRMLDLYYRTEAPLPREIEQIARLIRMRGQEDAIEQVVGEFFEDCADGWMHARCDAEIAKMQDKQAKAQASARASVNARSANAQRTLNERSTVVELPTPTPTPTPIANSQEDYGAKAPPSSARATVCKSLKAAGIADVNPSHPMLATLLDAGATEGEFIAAAGKAQGKANGFAYVLACVKGDRDRASLAAGQIHRGPLPNKQEALEARNRAVGEQWLKEMEARNAQ